MENCGNLFFFIFRFEDVLVIQTVRVRPSQDTHIVSLPTYTIEDIENGQLPDGETG